MVPQIWRNRGTEQKTVSLLIITVLLAASAFSAYHYFPVGTEECGNECQNWLTPINPTPSTCTTVCMEVPKPHPAYLPSLYLSVLTGFTTLLYIVLLIKEKVMTWIQCFKPGLNHGKRKPFLDYTLKTDSTVGWKPENRSTTTNKIVGPLAQGLEHRPYTDLTQKKLAPFSRRLCVALS